LSKALFFVFSFLPVVTVKKKDGTRKNPGKGKLLIEPGAFETGTGEPEASLQRDATSPAPVRVESPIVMARLQDLSSFTNLFPTPPGRPFHTST
jgi:hypothetical protein